MKTNIFTAVRNIAATLGLPLMLLGLLTMGCPEPAPVTRTVTLDANGGIYETDKPITIAVESGKTATAPTTGLPTFTGRTLAGWNTAKEGGTETNFVFGETKVTANITIYAQWTIDSHTITFNSNGGSTVPSVKVPYGDKATKPTDPTRTDYTFAGWYKDDTKFTNAFDFTTETIIADITLYAKWSVADLIVSFNSNGGSSVQPIHVANGYKITKPADPTRTDYTFAGWYKDNTTFNNAFDFTTETIIADITLYAKWTPLSSKTYTVSFNSNDGTTVGSLTVAHGNTITKPTDPTRTDYTFVGWYKDNTTFANAFDFTNETIIADITLYAKWVAPVTSIYLEKNKLTLLVGNTYTLAATVLPLIATNKTLSWVSNNDAVATVNRSTGVITPLAAGNVVIRVISNDNTNIMADATVTVTADLYYIPDNAFREALKKQSSNWFTPFDNGDGLNIATVKTFAGTIDVASKGIGSLSGIEYFTALTELDCRSNQLTNLDVSKNVALTSLICNNNQLSSLNVSNLTALTSLICNNNQLSSLSVSNLTALTSLACNDNQLSGLDVSKNVALTSLICNNNQLSSLNVSNLAALATLDCGNNILPVLDVSTNTALTDLYCNNNRLSSLDVSKNTKLTTLWCHTNVLTVLDLRGMRSATGLKITADGSGTNNNGLASLLLHDNLKINTEVQSVKISRGDGVIISTYSANDGSTTYTKTCGNWNPSGSGTCGTETLVTSITLSYTTNTKIVINKPITKTITYSPTVLPNDATNKTLIWTSSNQAVATVNSNGVLTPLAGGNTTITCTSTDGSNITKSVPLDVIPYFYIPDDNFRTFLKESNSPGLLANVDNGDGTIYYCLWLAAAKTFAGTIDVASRGIVSLSGIEYFTAMTELDCRGNQLTNLDVSKNVALTTLYCQGNQLTNLNVSGANALTTLVCKGNKLLSLYLDQNKALTTLDCAGNILNILDLRGMRSVSESGYIAITSGDSGTNNSGLTSIKVHSDLIGNSTSSKGSIELIAVKVTATGVQIDTYTSLGTTTYTSAICDFNPSTGRKVDGSSKACKW